MIVVDTSAVLAILWEEPEAGAFESRIISAEAAFISTANRLEAHIACLRRRGETHVIALDNLFSELKIAIAPFDEEQLAIARDAYERYRAGRHGLNFGDCFAYALARARDLPLLFKGEDFAATDVKRAV